MAQSSSHSVLFLLRYAVPVLLSSISMIAAGLTLIKYKYIRLLRFESGKLIQRVVIAEFGLAATAFAASFYTNKDFQGEWKRAMPLTFPIEPFGFFCKVAGCVSLIFHGLFVFLLLSLSHDFFCGVKYQRNDFQERYKKYYTKGVHSGILVVLIVAILNGDVGYARGECTFSRTDLSSLWFPLLSLFSIAHSGFTLFHAWKQRRYFMSDSNTEMSRGEIALRRKYYRVMMTQLLHLALLLLCYLLSNLVEAIGSILYSRSKKESEAVSLYALIFWMRMLSNYFVASAGWITAVFRLITPIDNIEFPDLESVSCPISLKVPLMKHPENLPLLKVSSVQSEQSESLQASYSNILSPSALDDRASHSQRTMLFNIRNLIAMTFYFKKVAESKALQNSSACDKKFPWPTHCYTNFSVFNVSAQEFLREIGFEKGTFETSIEEAIEDAAKESIGVGVYGREAFEHICSTSAVSAPQRLRESFDLMTNLASEQSAALSTTKKIVATHERNFLLLSINRNQKKFLLDVFLQDYHEHISSRPSCLERICGVFTIRNADTKKANVLILTNCLSSSNLLLEAEHLFTPVRIITLRPSEVGEMPVPSQSAMRDSQWLSFPSNVSGISDVKLTADSKSRLMKVLDEDIRFLMKNQFKNYEVCCVVFEAKEKVLDFEDAGPLPSKNYQLFTLQNQNVAKFFIREYLIPLSKPVDSMKQSQSTRAENLSPTFLSLQDPELYGRHLHDFLDKVL